MSLFERESFLNDIAQALRVNRNTLQDSDDLIDAGLDSIRMMMLIEKWRRQGIEISFIDLAERRLLGEIFGLIQGLHQTAPVAHTLEGENSARIL